MTDQNPHSAGDTAPDAAAPATAGAMLRQAREDAGLTIDAIAQQLKLAPRQVRALEEGDFAVLPGRTFVRGFIRNYARLLRIDVDAVVAALQSSTAAPTLEAPTLQPTAPSIGELPVTENNRPGWMRWAIPLTL
ncbi:MAG: helix-turn-helix domain-containing protein, partial [Aromatoleum sp.]|nr:helix-turn-helix domain-containing protein [Aromatoleum sp.]